MEVVARQTIEHGTSQAARFDIERLHSIDGAQPSGFSYEHVGPLSSADAPETVYFLLNTDNGGGSSSSSYLSYWPKSAEPGEEVSKLLVNLSEFHSNDYKLYLCGVHFTPHGPKFRANITTVLLFARKDDWKQMNDLDDVLELDKFDNDVLKCDVDGQWYAATRYDTGEEHNGVRPTRMVIAVASGLELTTENSHWMRCYRFESVSCTHIFVVFVGL